jgi:NADH-quinone oxidoreductase subunit C/D
MATLERTEAPDLAALNPGIVTPDTRTNYSGWIIDTNHLVRIAAAIRDRHGYDLLSSVTGVDYFPDTMEVVYHAYRTLGGPGLVFKVRVPRSDPMEVPSVTSVWPGAEFQEREIWDLFGIRFKDHPDLRRILMWEGFDGHPLRKDWHEPFYEEDNKPLKSRWPEGTHVSSEDRNLYKDNLQFPDSFDPEKAVFDGDAALYGALAKYQTIDAGIRTDHVVLNLGPQHPSTHGVFRAAVILDGETILSLKPVVGYLHRNHEKIGERNTFLQNMPYTDRLDYFNSMSNNWGYALAVEHLMGVKPPEPSNPDRDVAQRSWRNVYARLVCIRRTGAYSGCLRGRLGRTDDVQLPPLRRCCAGSAGWHTGEDSGPGGGAASPQDRRI